jgi:hypothetical protein
MTLPFVSQIRARLRGWQLDLVGHFAIVDVDRNDFSEHGAIKFFTCFDASLSEIHVYAPRGAATLWRDAGSWRVDRFDRETSVGLTGMDTPPRRAPLRARRVDFDCGARRCVIALAIADLRSLESVLTVLNTSGMRPATIELELCS